MYHQISRVTGRLVASTHLQSPLFPVAPTAVLRVEAPSVQYNTAQLSTVTEASACPAPGPRRLVPGTNVPYPPVPEKIRKQQELFQKDNGIPVFLKGGPMDAFLYRLTMALCIAGIIGVGHTIYIHSVPKK